MMGSGVVVGLVTSVGCAVVLRGLARRRRIVGKAGAPLSEQGRNLPPVGGLALAIGCLSGAIVWARQHGIPWTNELLGLTSAGAIVLTLGLVDDFVRELTPWQKLLGQTLAWLVLCRVGILAQIAVLPMWANWLISLVWTLAIINAFNLLDIADGLAIGIGLIASVAFLMLSLLSGQAVLAGLLAALCGALAGVLVFNFPQATLFLGDSGSLLLGLLLAALALSISYAPLGREVALFTPVIVLGLPIYDLAFVTLVRLRRGQPIFQKSEDHFVFRLVRSGWPPSRAVLAMFGLGLAFSAVAVVISQVSNRLGFTVLGVVVAVALGWGVRVAKVPAT